MKKFAGFVFIIVLLFQTLCLPALAADPDETLEVSKSMCIESGTYSEVAIMNGAALVIDHGANIIGHLHIEGILVVNGWLTGGEITIGYFVGGAVVLGNYGHITMTFEDEALADDFLAIIETDVCVEKWTNTDGSIAIEVTKCTHEETETLPADVEVCEGCNQVLSYTPVNTEASSTISEGNPAIIVGVVCLAVGLVGGLLIGKKKQKTQN